MIAKSKDRSPFSSKKIQYFNRSFLRTIKISKEIKNYKNENDISLCIQASTPPVDIPC